MERIYFCWIVLELDSIEWEEEEKHYETCTHPP
jgi:hypothetical protein